MVWGVKRIARTLGLGVLTFAAGFAAHALLGRADAAPSSQAASPYAAMGQLGRVLALVENEYVDPVERARLVEGAVKGMVGELDPHSAYMPAQDFKIFQSDTEGKFGGVGVEVDVRGDAVTVLAPIEGSPAERAGIKPGDKIVAVDGEDARNIGFEKMVRRMRGVPGTHVKLTVRRDGQKEPVTFDLVREVIKVSSVAGKLLDGNIAYLRIKQFQERTHEELLQSLAKLRLQARGAPLAGVLVDLRNDPGGLVDEASAVADELLASGTIYTTRHRGQITDEVSAHAGGALVDVPAVVLVNEWSASASELVAGALQDNARAVVVGTNTFGKGSVQTILELPGGAGIRLTTSRYYTPSGHAIQADGVHPDVTIESDRVTSNKLPSIREKDLEGALPGEGGGAARDGGVVVVAPPAGDGGVGDVEATSVRDIASDPTKGTDFTLKVAYQLVRGPLAGKTRVR